MPHRVAGRLCVLALVVLVACTGDDAAPPSTSRPEIRLTGSVLARTEAGGALVVIDPRDGTERPVTMPPGSILVHHASFAEDGSIVAVVEGPFGRFGVYRLGVDAEPEPLGPMLRGAFTFDGDDGSVLAAPCDARRDGYVLDVAHPATWRRVDARCGAALSPDGRSFATPVTRTRVDVVPVDAQTEASTAFAIDDLDGAEGFVPNGARITGRIAWDPQGLAFTIGTDEVESLVVVPVEGPVTVEAFGAHAEWIETTLAWQPEGSQIGAAGATRIEGVVRIADPGTGESRVVAILREPPFGILWSPDGRVLLASTLGRWMFIGPDGGWLRVLPYSRGRALPMDWRT